MPSWRLLKRHLIVDRTKRYPLICSYRQQNLLSLTTTLSLGKKYSIKFLELLLARNLHHLIRAFLWIILKQIFLKRRNCRHSFGVDDVSLIWTHGKEELEGFIDHIKFTFESNKQTISSQPYQTFHSLQPARKSHKVMFT